MTALAVFARFAQYHVESIFDPGQPVILGVMKVEHHRTAVGPFEAAGCKKRARPVARVLHASQQWPFSTRTPAGQKQKKRPIRQ
ncbi:MAG: hypothetical protein JHC61_14715 [Burkholderiaceae bacterium]|nr:hypothetical protein [Burkholderiaceae bacterium]